jgi:hypothetical protein
MTRWQPAGWHAALPSPAKRNTPEACRFCGGRYLCLLPPTMRLLLPLPVSHCKVARTLYWLHTHYRCITRCYWCPLQVSLARLVASLSRCLRTAPHASSTQTRSWATSSLPSSTLPVKRVSRRLPTQAHSLELQWRCAPQPGVLLKEYALVISFSLVCCANFA